MFEAWFVLNVARTGDLRDALQRRIIERNFPDLPKGLNLEFWIRAWMGFVSLFSVVFLKILMLRFKLWRKGKRIFWREKCLLKCLWKRTVSLLVCFFQHWERRGWRKHDEGRFFLLSLSDLLSVVRLLRFWLKYCMFVLLLLNWNWRSLKNVGCCRFPLRRFNILRGRWK